MQHVISIGGGLSSTMELPRRVLAQADKTDCRFIMARLPNEDPDVWRLCDAVSTDLGITIEYIGLGLDPWAIFWQEGMIGNSRVDPCSRRLKREVLAAWMAENCNPTDTVLHLGITYHEVDRMIAVRANWHRAGWQVDAPLAGDPMITRERLMQACQDRYSFVPRLYQMGFSHNNCGGACVKAGLAEWARLLWYLPDVYAWWEEQEFQFNAVHRNTGLLAHLTGADLDGKAIVSILRDRRGGLTTPLLLGDFRERMQRRWASMLPGIDPFEGLESTPPCAWCEAA